MTDDARLPLFQGHIWLTDADRPKIIKVADACIRTSKDLSGNDVHVAVIGMLNAIGYMLARADPKVAPAFIEAVGASVRTYVDIYRQDGPGNRFSKDS